MNDPAPIIPPRQRLRDTCRLMRHRPDPLPPIDLERERETFKRLIKLHRRATNKAWQRAHPGWWRRYS